MAGVLGARGRQDVEMEGNGQVVREGQASRKVTNSETNGQKTTTVMEQLILCAHHARYVY